MKNVANVLFLGVVLVGGFLYRDTLENIWSQSVNRYFPCKTSISYGIGDFDSEFGVSKEDFLSAIKEAEELWEKPIGRELFNYEEDGSLKINLIYDVRQETTQKLEKMGIIVQNNKASYDSLKLKYDSLSDEYDSQKIYFQNRLATFETRRKAYEAEVAQANKKGGASKEVYDRLNAEKEYLSKEVSALNRLQDELNSNAIDINAVAKALNDLAKTLNIGVEQYNEIGDNLEGEFDEGVYKSGPTGRYIDIYQFENRTKLVRVLAHELGHALGLDHVDDTKAIMYRLNVGSNERLTSTDISELKKLCGVQ